MAGQEEVVQPHNMAEVRQDVTKPSDEPAQGKYGAHLRPRETRGDRNTHTDTDTQTQTQTHTHTHTHTHTQTHTRTRTRTRTRTLPDPAAPLSLTCGQQDQTPPRPVTPYDTLPM